MFFRILNNCLRFYFYLWIAFAGVVQRLDFNSTLVAFWKASLRHNTSLLYSPLFRHLWGTTWLASTHEVPRLHRGSDVTTRKSQITKSWCDSKNRNVGFWQALDVPHSHNIYFRDQWIHNENSARKSIRKAAPRVSWCLSIFNYRIFKFIHQQNIARPARFITVNAFLSLD